MNSRVELLYRLLKLYPVRAVRETFEISEFKQSDVLLEVSTKSTEAAILDFAFKNFDLTKRHVYLLTHEIKRLSAIPKTLLPGISPYETSTQKGSVEHFYFFDVQYDVIFLDPLEKKSLKFKLPIYVRIQRDGRLTVQFTILEKNVAAYFSQSRPPIAVNKNVEESILREKILKALGAYGIMRKVDLTKEIKDLWQSCLIDAVYVNWKRSKSTSIESMDEEHTLKEQYPDLYEEIMLAPLQQVVFRFKDDRGQYSRRFAVDPTQGKITLSSFALPEEPPDNVIKRLLEYNK